MLGGIEVEHWFKLCNVYKTGSFIKLYKIAKLI